MPDSPFRPRRAKAMRNNACLTHQRAADARATYYCHAAVNGRTKDPGIALNAGSQQGRTKRGTIGRCTTECHAAPGRNSRALGTLVHAGADDLVPPQDSLFHLCPHGRGLHCAAVVWLCWFPFPASCFHEESTALYESRSSSTMGPRAWRHGQEWWCPLVAPLECWQHDKRQWQWNFPHDDLEPTAWHVLGIHNESLSRSVRRCCHCFAGIVGHGIVGITYK